MTIECFSDSAAEKAAIEGWIRFKLIDEAEPPNNELLSKSTIPTTDGRLCGNNCYNINKNQISNHEYGGWYYDIYYDESDCCYLVRFDEDDINNFEILWTNNDCFDIQIVKTGNFIIQANLYGVFIFINSFIICFSHEGHFKKWININDIFLSLASKFKKEEKEYTKKYNKPYNPDVFSSVWVYGHSIYFTNDFDYFKGMIYKYNLSTEETQIFKIAKPHNQDHNEVYGIMGDERYLLFNNNRILDVLTEKVYKADYFYVDFETKRCYYLPNKQPTFVPEGFTSIQISDKLYRSDFMLHGERGGDFFYYRPIFTGDTFYGFKYGHFDRYKEEEDHYYNLYKLTDNNWEYLNAGARGGYEDLHIQGKYLYFDCLHGRRAKLDGSGMDSHWIGSRGAYGVMMESEKIFRKQFLQVREELFDI